MKSQDLLNGPLGIIFLLALSRLLPSKAGYRITHHLGRKLGSNRHSPMVKAVRANQWVASGCQASAAELDRLTELVYIHQGCALFDYYRNFQNKARTDQLVTLDESFLQVIEHSIRRDRPQLLVMPHYANYDLSAMSAANHGLRMQVLSYPNPGRGYRWQNKFRNVHHVEVTPIAISSLRLALQNLEEGGTVFTGVDRPFGETTLHPVFFGKPSHAPTGYIRLALKTGTPIQLVLCNTSPDGKYVLAASDPIPIIRNPDPLKEQLINVERVLSVIEKQIKIDPTHWSMFYPVWPDLMHLVP